MNQTERFYYNILEDRIRSGEIDKASYERFTIRIADNCTYTPDFYVHYPDGRVEFIEIKGTWKGRGQDAARVKLKVAADQNPEFPFIAIVIKNKKIISEERFN